MTAVSAVYVYNINGTVKRRVASNSHALMSEIKRDISRENNLTYDFDLTYKDQQVSEGSSLYENHFSEDFPLRVIQRSIEQTTRRSTSSRHPEPSLNMPLLQRILRVRRLIRRIFRDWFDKLNDERTGLTNEYQPTPSVENHLPPATRVDEEQYIGRPSMNRREHLRSRLPTPLIQEPHDETEVQPMGASIDSSSLPTTRITDPVDIALVENSITITPCSDPPETRHDVSNNLLVQPCQQGIENDSYSLEKDAADRIVSSTEVEENIPNESNSPSDFQYHIVF